MRRTGVAALCIGLLLLAGAGGVAVVQRRLDPDALRRAVIASVERQSGRTMTLGRLDVRLLPSPRVLADDVTLSDLPGPPAAPMLRIGHLSAGIGVWPLLRHVVRLHRLALDHVTLHVLRDADGHGNWEMRPRPAAPRTSGGGASGGRARWGIELGTVEVVSAKVSLHDGLMHRDAELDLDTLAVSGLQGEQPRFSLVGASLASASLAGGQAGTGYELHGSAGPVRRLFDGGDRRTAWPLSVQGSETVAGAVVARAEVAGTFADPVHGRGYDLTFSAALAQLADLNRLFTHAGLPRMQGLDASGHVLDDGHPAFAALRARAGATVIRGLQGVTLQGWSVAASTPAAPLEVAAAGSWHGQALVLKGTAASLQVLDAMLGGHGVTGPPVPVRLALGVGGSAWRIGGVAGAEAGDVRLQGSVPDLRILYADAPDPGQVTLGARLQADSSAIRLSDLQLVSAAGDVGGALTLSLRGRHRLTGQLRSSRMDIDRMAAGTPRPAQAAAASQPAQTPEPAKTPVPTQGEPRQVAAATEAPVAANATSSPLPSPDATRIWAMLRAGDADLSLQVGDLLIGGMHYRDFVTHARLEDGRLLAEPQANGPAGVIAARLQADAAASPPTLRVWMHPVMLPASALAGLPGAAGLFGEQGLLRGTVELAGDVRASGESWAALAGSAQGHLGLSMTDAAVSNARLLRLIGQSSAIAVAVPATGETAVRCLALHAALDQGQAVMDTLSLRSRRLSVDGHGQIRLLDGALDLHLQPQAQVGAAWATLPVRLGGSLRDPHPALDAAASGGRYRLTIGSGADPADPDGMKCDTPLRLAREGMTGPAPAVSPVPEAGRRKAPKPMDILRGLGFLR